MIGLFVKSSFDALLRLHEVILLKNLVTISAET